MKLYFRMVLYSSHFYPKKCLFSPPTYTYFGRDKWNVTNKFKFLKFSYWTLCVLFQCQIELYMIIWCAFTSSPITMGWCKCVHLHCRSSSLVASYTSYPRNRPRALPPCWRLRAASGATPRPPRHQTKFRRTSTEDCQSKWSVSQFPFQSVLCLNI